MGINRFITGLVWRGHILNRSQRCLSLARSLLSLSAWHVADVLYRRKRLSAPMSGACGPSALITRSGGYVVAIVPGLAAPMDSEAQLSVGESWSFPHASVKLGHALVMN